MAITASGLFVANFIDVFDATQLAVDLSLTSHKFALLSDVATPNFDTNAVWSTLSGNEVSGTGWAAGGVLWSAAAAGNTSVAPTNTISPAGTYMHDMTDVSVAGTTLTNAMCMVAVAVALSSALLYLIDFVTAVSTNAGTLGVQFAAGGVATIDLTP